MIKDLEAVFDKYEGEYDEFTRIPEAKRHSTRADLHAFILLDRLIPSKKDSLLAHVSDEKVWLSIDTDELAEIATEEHILDLIRCGVILDENGLYLFVG